jgi:hypothetical protein
MKIMRVSETLLIKSLARRERRRGKKTYQISRPKDLLKEEINGHGLTIELEEKGYLQRTEDENKKDLKMLNSYKKSLEKVEQKELIKSNK